MSGLLTTDFNLPTEEEIKVKYVCKIMFTEFVPMLQNIFMKANEEKFKKYQGNCCRQISIFGCYALSYLLKDYRWTSWEAEFSDIYDGRRVEYEHAWIFGRNEKTNHRLLIDLARNHRPNLFIEVKSNKYPLEICSEYKNMKEIKRTQIDWEDSLNKNEYYTKKPGIEIAKYVLTEMLKN